MWDMQLFALTNGGGGKRRAASVRSEAEAVELSLSHPTVARPSSDCKCRKKVFLRLFYLKTGGYHAYHRQLWPVTCIAAGHRVQGPCRRPQVVLKILSQGQKWSIVLI